MKIISRVRRHPEKWKLGLGVAGIGLITAVLGIRTASEAVASPADAARAVIEVEQGSCANCTPGVRRALREAGGVQELGEGDPKDRIVVTYERAEGRPGHYVAALKAAGYQDARLVEPGS